MQEKFVLRPFQTADAAQCCDVINKCIPLMEGLNDAARIFLVSKNTPMRLIEELQSLFAITCCDDQMVLGFGALDHARGEIKRVYIDPQRQHQGIGRAVMEALEGEAHTARLASIFV